MYGVPGWLRTGCVPALVLALSLALTGGVLAARPGAQAAAPPGPPPPAGAGAPARPQADPDPWSLRAPYPIPISRQALTQQSGALYSFGGVSQGHGVAAAYKYDPAANQWPPIRPLLQSLSGASAVSADGAIYILNGFDGHADQNVLYRYDPRTDNYTDRTPPTIATSAQAAVYLDGHIYRIGGFTNGSNSQPTATFEVYTVATDSWSAPRPYPQALAWIMATAANGMIYTAGGVGADSQGTAKTYRYDPATGLWDDGAVPDLPATLWGSASGLVNGRWMLAGGIENGTIGRSLLTWDRDPAHPWVKDPLHRLPQARYSMGSTAGALTLYSVGGCPLGDCGPGTRDTQQYQAPLFWDVHTDDYFFPAVGYLVQHNIISGYADGTFHPYNNTTRGQLAKIVALAEGWPLVTPPTPHFSDVPPGSPFYSVIETAVAHGVISGYTDGTFRPSADVTRGQLAKIIVKARGWPITTSGGPHFRDVPQDSPFYDYVETAVARGVISGYNTAATCPMGVPCFWPGNPATRGQIAKIVYLAILAGPGPPTPTPTPTRTPIPPSPTPTPIPPCVTTWQLVYGAYGPTLPELHAVAVVSANDVWAVGDSSNSTNYLGLTLIEHWNGTDWSLVPSPNANPNTNTNILFGVAAVSANNVWAVGSSTDLAGNPSQTLIEHWNGTSWSIVPSPNAATGSGELHAITVVSAADIWAAGYSYDRNTGSHTLVEHWDGGSWIVVPSPDGPSNTGLLYGIAAVATNDVWAVGSGEGDLILHWNGVTWSVIAAPALINLGTQLLAVTAIAGNDVWAAGFYFDEQDFSRTLTLHWDGSHWAVVSSPNVGEDYLYGAAAVGPHDVWAVGVADGQNTLTEHWDGSTWSIVPSQNGGGGLSGVAAVTGRDLWAVGAASGVGEIIERYYCP